MWSDNQVSSAPVKVRSYTQVLSCQLSWSIHGKVKRRKRKWEIVSRLGKRVHRREVCLSWIVWDKTSSGLWEAKIVKRLMLLVRVCAFTGIHSPWSWVWEPRKANVLNKNKNRWGRNTGGEVNFMLCMLGLRAWIKAANLNRVMILSNGVAATHLQNELSLLCFSRDGGLMLEENRVLK